MRFGFLKDVKVVEFGRVLSAPYASKLLMDMGAKVTKLETGSGDPYRHLPPFVGKDSMWYQNYNYGKKVIKIGDLKNWRRNLSAMNSIKNADIFIENFKPGTLREVQMGYTDLKRINKEIIYTSITAFGQEGSFKNHPGYDLIAESAAGYLLAHPGDRAMYPHTFLGDYASGLLAAFSSVSALVNRKSVHIDISMFDVLASWSLILNIAMFYDKGFKDRIFKMDVAAFPYGVYQTLDNKQIAIAAVGERMANRFFIAFKAELEAKNIAFDDFLSPDSLMKLHEIVTSILKEKKANEITERLDTSKVPWSNVEAGVNLLNLPLVRERELYKDVKIKGTGHKLLRTPVTVSYDK